MVIYGVHYARNVHRSVSKVKERTWKILAIWRDRVYWGVGLRIQSIYNLHTESRIKI